jgi:hypothetical protein
LVPYLSVGRELEAKKIIKIDFDTQALTNNWYIISIKNKMLDQASQTFIEMTKRRFASIPILL